MINVPDLLLGWVLGIFSPLVVDRVQRRRRAIEFRRTVLGEFTELQYKMGLVAYRLLSHLCLMDRPFLTWLQPVVEAYNGPEQSAEMAASLRRLNARSDAELLAAWQERRTPGRAVGLVRYSLPFLDSQLNMISDCSMDFQRRVFEIRAQLDIFNSGVELAKELLMRTFDQSITGDNRTTLEGNLEDNYVRLARRAQDIARLVSGVNG